MNLLKKSLGTNCAHCHQTTPTRDMSVDTDTKKIARSMLDMQSKMNDKLMTADGMGLRENKVQKATCYMCHKGAEKPQIAPEKADDEKRFNDSVAAGKHKRTADAMKNSSSRSTRTTSPGRRYAQGDLLDVSPRQGQHQGHGSGW